VHELKRLGRGALVWLFYLVVATLYTYPLAFRLSTAILKGGLGDYITEASIVAWNARQILHDPLRLHDLPFYYPYSHTVAYQQSQFFSGLLAAPWLALGAPPLFLASFLVLAALATSGALMYLLAQTITGRVLPSLLAGMTYAFFTNRMDHLGQFTYQMAALPPLILWSLHRVLKGAGWRDLGLLVGALWAQVLSGIYQAFGLAFVLVGFVVTFLLLRPAAPIRRLLGRSALALAVLAAALAPFLWPYLAHHRELGFERDIGEAEWFGMDLLSILDAGVFNTLYHGRLLHLARAEGGLFPGFVALGLAAVALGTLPGTTAPQSRRWIDRTQCALAAGACLCLLLVAVAAAGGFAIRIGGVRLLSIHDLTLPVNLLPVLALIGVALEGSHRRTGPLVAREWVLVALFLAVLAYLLTLAPTIKIAEHGWGTAPFRWIYFHIPGASAFRAPGRWSLAFALPLALLVALGANALAERLDRRRGAVLATLLVAMIVELNVFPLPWTRIQPIPPVYPWLAAQPDDFAVLELPLAEGGWDAQAMFWAANTHWKRLVNGGGGFPLDTTNEIVTTLRPVFDPDGFVQAIRRVVPLRYVVVHSDGARLAERLRAAAPLGLRLTRQFGTDDVYELTGTPDTGIDLRRHFSSDFGRTHPKAEFAVRFDGDDRDVDRWVEVTFNGRPLRRIDANEAGAITLSPPFFLADRNELRFLHRYRVRSDVARSDAYRIGSTGRSSPVDIQVTSAGRDQGALASSRINGHEVVNVPRRGYNVVALDEADGHVLWVDAFDTFRSQAESRRMADRIGALAPGTLVIAAVKVDGGGQLTSEGVAALRSVGGQQDLQRTLWLSHALIGVRGAPPGSAIEAAGMQRITLSVGQERGLTVMLGAFSLR
jgi:hypothetical protein